MAGREDAETTQRNYKAPYTSHNPIPTIRRYREEKEQRQELANDTNGTQQEDGPSKTQQAVDAYKDWRDGRYEGQDGATESSSFPYRSENKNYQGGGGEMQGQDHRNQAQSSPGAHDDGEVEGREEGEGGDDSVVEDTSQMLNEQDPRKKRKGMEKRKDDGAEREVTDPVTHLPVTIHDFTDKDLENTPENEPSAGMHLRSATSVDAKSKTTDQLRDETVEGRRVHRGMEKLFPPPDYDMAKLELIRIYHSVLTVGLAFVLAIMVTLLLLEKMFGIAGRLESSIFRPVSPGNMVSSTVLLSVGLGLGTSAIWALRGWIEKKVRGVWENCVWEAERQHGKEMAESEEPESVQWLNSLLASVWPLVNPDLFISLADTLEVSVALQLATLCYHNLCTTW